MSTTPQVDTRETRDWAREIKFLVDASLYPAIVQWSRENLGPDGHGSGDYKDEYSTTSLYFETPEFDVYRRKESYGRAKYRARRYGMMDVVFLERKFRTDRLLSKRRTTVPIPEVQKLTDPVPDKSWAAYWFHRRILLRRLQPLTQMSYDRVARIGAAQYGPVRMTIDKNLRVLPMPDRAFIPGVGFPLIEDKCIVEVKYRVELPAMFRQLTEKYQLAPMSVSKYRIGLKVLDYAPPTKADSDVPSTPGGTPGTTGS